VDRAGCVIEPCVYVCTHLPQNAISGGPSAGSSSGVDALHRSFNLVKSGPAGCSARTRGPREASPAHPSSGSPSSPTLLRILGSLGRLTRPTSSSAMRSSHRCAGESALNAARLLISPTPAAGRKAAAAAAATAARMMCSGVVWSLVRRSSQHSSIFRYDSKP
jgi:hypothetical protein